MLRTPPIQYHAPSNSTDSEILRETLPGMELFEQTAGDLVVDNVALSDIDAG